VLQSTICTSPPLRRLEKGNNGLEDVRPFFGRPVALPIKYLLNHRDRGPTRMDATAKTCPKCGSGDYQFRSRRKIAAADGQGEQTETKYRCKGCGHEWKVKAGAT
jgi:DNA-directed RNA polymerase subunit M/transcription elongation factor TFIIS